MIIFKHGFLPEIVPETVRVTAVCKSETATTPKYFQSLPVSTPLRPSQLMSLCIPVAATKLTVNGLLVLKSAGSFSQWSLVGLKDHIDLGHGGWDIQEKYVC